MIDSIIVNLKKKIVLDTSIIIDGHISHKIDTKDIDDNFEIIIPRAAIDELQSQACKQREHGFIGLAELRKIKEKLLKIILLRIYGDKPNLEDIKLAKNGRIDAIIAEITEKENATLYTADYIQHLAANATGISSLHIRSPVSASFDIENYFDDKSMSVHLIEGVEPSAKKGTSGEFTLEKISDTKLDKQTLNEIMNFLFSTENNKKISNLEISFDGCYVVIKEFENCHNSTTRVKQNRNYCSQADKEIVPTRIPIGYEFNK